MTTLKEQVKAAIVGNIYIDKFGISNLYQMSELKNLAEIGGVYCSIKTIRMAVKELVDEKALEAIEAPHIRKGAVTYRIPSPKPATPVKKRITDDQIRQMRLMLARGCRNKDIVQAFGVDSAIPSDLRAGRIYKGRGLLLVAA